MVSASLHDTAATRFGGAASLQWVQTVLRNEAHYYDLFRMTPTAFQCLHDT
jgi:predicted 2-oxoglutarate/Fe(II)-dependent dioxygenase YbiX